ncbi:MAG TPA: mechanosensitive ion channel family protein [Terriglobia bacterium]|nr:mechanosensitive ion channel family protein [Terriglobia bacterium]
MRRVMVCVWAAGILFAITIGGQRALAETRAASGTQMVASSHSRLTAMPATAPDVKKGKVGQNPSAALRAAGTVLNSQGLTTLVRRLVITALVLVVALLLLIGIRRVRHRALAALEQKRGKIPSFRFRGLELVSAQALFRNVARIAMAVYVVAFSLVILGTALIVFGQFPATQGYAQQVGLWLWNPIVAIALGMLGYLPNLFYIVIILVVTRFILRMINYVFRAAERGLISLEPWVHQDVARPTGLLVRIVVVVVALFFIAPLIPGTGSTAAKGISIVLGLMISFGSTSSVGNFVAGIVLMYMRPFQLGERVKIGETVGDVTARTFLYTKVLTIKNEDVMVPSLTALGSSIINYSSRAREQGLILHTSVTIGYDAPWRKVHGLLLGAAERTEQVAKDPKPFVLQTALDDFYVKYQINVYTNQASQMAQIYSELHQNIQDAFNEAQMEICSPHYQQLRDGNSTTIPAQYRGKDYEAPRFRIENAARAPK